MTNNTIPNVPRKLKPCPFCGDIPSENSHALTDGGFKYGAIQCGCGALGPDVRTEYKDWPHWRDAAFAAWNERALLSAPSPAGVDGLEVVATLLIDDPADQECGDWDIEVESKVAERMAELGGGQHDLCSLSDAQAIIDGLRGEVGAQRVKTCIALKERNDAREERDQHAQRIGELEGLLRDVRGWIEQSSMVYRHNSTTVTLYRIDAAMSSGKDSAP